MVLNDTPQDIRHMLVDARWTSVDLADAVGTTPQSVRTVIKHSIIPVRPALLKLIEELGYDIRLQYVPRKVE